jgi:hypothetical protein
MPTTTKFTTLGKFNGFPFCPPKIDVSLYYKWTTLGGTQKGNTPTAAEKTLSHKNAMKLFWNAHEVLGSVSSTNVSNPLPSVIFTKYLLTDPEEPKDRVCPRQSQSFYVNTYRETVGASSIAGTITISIARMYDGATDNESNFVGYGMNLPIEFSADTATAGVPGFAEASVEVQSFMPFVPPPSGGTDDFDDAYVTFAGFPVLVSAESSASGNTSATVLSNASSLTASASYEQTQGPQTYSGTSSASLTNIDFYTYP